MTSQPKKRKVADFRKGIRKNPPKVRSDIEKLVDGYIGSDDQKAFKKRFKRN